VTVDTKGISDDNNGISGLYGPGALNHEWVQAIHFNLQNHHIGTPINTDNSRFDDIA
jgi:hypothetical protein